MTETTSIISVGQAAALLQAMPGRIREAAETLGIKPTCRINLVDHYSEADLERIAEHLRAAKEQRHDREDSRSRTRTTSENPDV